MTPTRRDPRIAAAEGQTGTTAEAMQPTQPEQTEQPTLVEQAIPAAGTKEHAQYVEALLDRIKMLEEQARTETGLGGLPRVLGLRVSPKGGVSVYGLNANFPVTLYPEQWARLFEQEDRVKEFINANKDVLTFKDDEDEIRNRKEDLRRKAGIVPRQPLRNIPRAA